MTPDLPIRLEGRTIYASQISKLEVPEAWEPYAEMPSYAQEVLNFCHQWLRGTQSFQQQTSGSTGKPKEITITREQMIASASMTARALDLQPGDRALLCLSATYIAGKMMLVRALETGMELWAVPPSSQPLNTIHETVDFMAVVPLQMKSILDSGQDQIYQLLNKMKAVIIGGAAVSTELEQLIARKVGCPVYSTYGMTETVSHVALRRLNGRNRSDYFQLLPGIEAKQDHRGCLMVRGEVSRRQWLTTNDIVEMQDALHFRWRGRADHVINSGGVKIHTEELEKKLEAAVRIIGKDRRFFVAGLEDRQLGQRVCLFIEGKEAPSEQLSNAQNWCKNELKMYERPKQFIFVPQFTQTPNGKISRSRTIGSLAKD